MTLCLPHAAAPATGPAVVPTTGPAVVPGAAPASAPVAARVAERMLGLVDDPAAAIGRDGGGGTGGIGWEIGWAGPLALPLPDERAVQAACGIMHVHGRAAGRPVPLAVDYASTVAGVLAAQGVCAARFARARGGGVTGVRTSVGQAALLAIAQYLAAATADRDGAESAHSAGGADGAVGVDGTRQAPGGCTLVSAEGVRFEIETLVPEQWLDFWQRLGADRATTGRAWRAFQQRFATATCPLPAALPATARGAAFATIRAAADGSGVGVLPVRDDPAPPGPVRPWTLTPYPEPADAAPAPGSGRASAAATAGLPLAGVRVVESTRRVQGPMAGHALRLLGADVVHVEPPGGDPMRGIPPMAGSCSARFSALNSGKSVAEVDFTTAAGRQAVRELVSGADVFLHNWAPGKAARLGLEAEDLRSANPALVYAWASGWGDTMGPTPPVGTDYLVQAHSGLGAAVRPAGEPPAPSLMTLTDVLGGLVCAQGVLAALLARLRTGHGRRVDSSLYSAAAVIPRRRERDEWGLLDRPLRTRDGYIAAGPAARERPDLFARALGLGVSASAAALTARARTRPTADWLPSLAEAGMAATPVCTDLADLARDPRFAGALTDGDIHGDIHGDTRGDGSGDGSGDTDGYAGGGYSAALTPWEFS